MHTSIQDLRTAARALVRAPRFTVVAVFTLSVAIAVNAAMFTFVSAVFVRPLPYASPEGLRDLSIDMADGSVAEAPAIRWIDEVLSPLGAPAAYAERGFVVSLAGTGGSPVFVQGAATEERLFGVLGLVPVLGRGFTPADLVPGAPPTVILSDRFWRAWLDGRRDAIGSTIRIDGREHTIIGVMARRFAFPDFAEFWIAELPADARFGATRVLFRAHGTADAAADALEAALSTRGIQANVRLTDLLPHGGGPLAALLGAIGFVLLIACSNVANLVLARGAGRRHEIGLRAAIGASRGALLRHLSTEGLLIAVVAAGIGTVGSAWLADAIVAIIPSDGLPVWFEMRLDASVLAYVGALTAITVLISATLPAFTVTRGNLAMVMNEAGSRAIGDGGSARLRSSFVGAQIALAMILITGAALLLRAFQSMNDVDPGYAADSVLELRVRRALPTGAAGFTMAALERVGGIAGVTAAAATLDGPAGRAVPTADPGRAVSPLSEAVSPGYFETMQLPLAAGTSFETGTDSRVAVISESTADLMFGDAASAIGATFAFDSDPPGTARRVIGVARDRRRPMLGGTIERQRHVYVPLSGEPAGEIRLLARVGRDDPASIVPAAVSVLRDLDPDAVLRAPRDMGAIERDLAGEVRVFASLFTAFGAIALALAAVGIWGVVSYTISRRTREIGLRIALGATPSRVVREAAGGLLLPVAAGLALGSLGAIAMGSLLRRMLFGAGAADPIALGAVMVLFGAVSAASAWLPARKAARIDPLEALRAA